MVTSLEPPRPRPPAARRAAGLSALLLVTVVGCKDRPASTAGGGATGSAARPAPAAPSPSAAPPAAAPTPAPAPAAAPVAAPSLPAGEALFQAATAEELPNPYTWQVGGRRIVVTITDRQEEDLSRPSVMRVLADGVEVARDEYNPAYDAFAGITAEAGGRLAVVLGDSGGSGDPGHLTAVLLSADGGTISVAETWRGDDAGDKPPAWVHRDKAADRGP